AAIRRRLDIALALLALGAMSLQMRRNIAQFCLVASPLALIAIRSIFTQRATAETRSQGALRVAANAVPAPAARVPAAVILCGTLALTVWWLAGLWTGHFYFTERRPGRRLAAG